MVTAGAAVVLAQAAHYRNILPHKLLWPRAEAAKWSSDDSTRVPDATAGYCHRREVKGDPRARNEPIANTCRIHGSSVVSPRGAGQEVEFIMRVRNRAIVATIPCALVVAVVVGVNLADRDPRLIDTTTSANSAPAHGAAPIDIESNHRTGVGEIHQDDSTISTSITENSESAASSLAAETLKLEIESTMVGMIDPGSFLDTALALSKLEVSKSPLPEPHPSGAIRYPVLGLPEGTKAELWLLQSKTGEYGSPRMMYHLTVDQPNPYIFEGAARKALEAQISLWTDTEGNVKHFGVLTESMVSGRSAELGMPAADRKLPIGALFSYDASRPHEWHASSSFLDNDRPVEDTANAPAVRGQWPRTEDLEVLKRGLLSQLGTL